jgi:mannose-6-phosphate isomerase-like protein (cupin superfamily)
MKKSGGQIWREGQTKLKSEMKAKFVEKEWGHEIWMVNSPAENYCGKILRINQGYNSSLHFHLDKHETFYVTKGSLQVDLIDTIDGVKITKILNEGDTMPIDRGQPHQLIAYDGDVEFIEISTFHRDSDSKRIKR